MTIDRPLPNILITGTPGNGKTTTAELLCQSSTELTHVNVGKIVKELSLHDGYDKELDSYFLNEDKLCDELEERLSKGGCVVDYHGCAFFPERWFDLVIVLQTDNTILYSRLEKRGYSEKKIESNLDCEIMQVILDEARESYAPEIVIPLTSNTIQEMEDNVDRIQTWMENWKNRNH